MSTPRKHTPANPEPAKNVIVLSKEQSELWQRMEDEDEAKRIMKCEQEFAAIVDDWVDDLWGGKHGRFEIQAPGVYDNDTDFWRVWDYTDFADLARKVAWFPTRDQAEIFVKQQVVKEKRDDLKRSIFEWLYEGSHSIATLQAICDCIKKERES